MVSVAAFQSGFAELLGQMVTTIIEQGELPDDEDPEALPLERIVRYRLGIARNTPTRVRKAVKSRSKRHLSSSAWPRVAPSRCHLASPVGLGVVGEAGFMRFMRIVR